MPNASLNSRKSMIVGDCHNDSSNASVICRYKLLSRKKLPKTAIKPVMIINALFEVAWMTLQSLNWSHTPVIKQGIINASCRWLSPYINWLAQILTPPINNCNCGAYKLGGR